MKDENLKRRERHGGIGLGDETNSLPEFIDDMRFSALSKKKEGAYGVKIRYAVFSGIAQFFEL